MPTPSCWRSSFPTINSTNPTLPNLSAVLIYLLQVALTKAKANLLGTALTNGVNGDLLRIALTEAREDTLAAALTAADPDLLTAALTDAAPNLLATALTDAEVGLLGVALTRGVARELLITALTR